VERARAEEEVLDRLACISEELGTVGTAGWQNLYVGELRVGAPIKTAHDRDGPPSFIQGHAGIETPFSSTTR